VKQKTKKIVLLPDNCSIKFEEILKIVEEAKKKEKEAGPTINIVDYPDILLPYRRK